MHGRISTSYADKLPSRINSFLKENEKKKCRRRLLDKKNPIDDVGKVLPQLF